MDKFDEKEFEKTGEWSSKKYKEDQKVLAEDKKKNTERAVTNKKLWGKTGWGDTYLKNNQEDSGSISRGHKGSKEHPRG